MKQLKFWMAAILTLCGTMTAWAQTSYDYFYRSWDADKKEVKTEIRNCTSYTAINGSDTSDSGWLGLYSGWYVVTGNSNYKTLNVLGDDVHLIIPDMVTLTLTGGVKLETGKKLTIYSQGGDVGQLIATNDYSGAAGIGGGSGESCGDLIIHGGIVKATGGEKGAGIGGGKNQGFYGGLTIYGGTVTAQGGQYGAGIGSGDENESNVAGYITIYGGTVTATGGEDAAGIGGGDKGNGASLSIYGGTVNAYAWITYTSIVAPEVGSGAGIGGGRYGNGVETFIYGGTVTARGSVDGAGIGGGNGAFHSGKGNGGRIEIHDGTVNATGFSQSAAIGCGYRGESATIIISGGDVTAQTTKEGSYGAGIGAAGDAANLDITISGGTVTASGTQGIGGGGAGSETSKGDLRYHGTLKITGGTVYADGGARAIGGYNTSDFVSNMMELYDGAMVKYDIEYKSEAAAANRKSTCVNKTFVAIMPCDHSGATYTVSGTTTEDTHTKHCNYCTTAFESETHTFTDGRCTVCGVEATAYTVTIYYPNTASDNDYTSTTYQMVPNTTFNLPAPPTEPAKLEFAGWLVGTHSNGSFIADGGETLLAEGHEYTITGNTTFTARYRYLDISLADAADNTETLVEYLGMTANSVTLSGRTLYKDGSWNTLCLPFAMDATQIAASDLAGATIKELNTETSNLNPADGTLTLNFTTAYDPTDAPSGSIVAGRPYIVKWATTGDNISNPVFPGVTISSTAPTAVEFDITGSSDKCQFVGQYSPFSIVASGATGSDQGNVNEIIMLGSGSKLGYSQNPRTLNCFRAHFYVPADPVTGQQNARRFVMDFGEGSSQTGILTVTADTPSATGIYTLDGRRLQAEPTEKGVYIVNGRKVIIK